jgi:glycosyltransferase involved in cell wall biosynthesis
MREIKVSIITIFFNAEKFLEEAINSAIAQTYDAWELLLIDDGSSDGSTEIALRYAQEYPEKVRYLEHKNHQNLGMSAARNLGINNAKGEYISFLDADDLWLPNKLEQQVAILESQPDAAFLCAPALWWYGWTDKPEDLKKDFVQHFALELNTVVAPPKLLILFLQDEWASLCDILVPLELVKSVGGYESSFRGMYEDQAFHAKLCLRSPVFVSSQCWYWYRQHSDACTMLSHQAKQTRTARYIFLTWLKNYLSQQGFKNTEIWQVVQQEIQPYLLLSRLQKRVELITKQINAIVRDNLSGSQTR